MRAIDFDSWQGVLTTILGLVIVTLLGVGIRVLAMQTIQQRRERMNRQINERLKTLIAAYRTLGGSFTGRLTVDPRHLKDMRMRASEQDAPGEDQETMGSSERSRRMRDAVEAALSDIILLGTVEQVRLASQAANDMVAGRPIKTAELVISLRDFIRIALDLGPIPDDITVSLQGPARIQGSGRAKSDGEKGGAKGSGGGGGGAGGGGGEGMGVGGMGAVRDDEGRAS